MVGPLRPSQKPPSLIFVLLLCLIYYNAEASQGYIASSGRYLQDEGVNPWTTVGPSSVTSHSSCGSGDVPYSGEGTSTRSRVHEVKQMTCPSNGACSIPLFVDRHSVATLLAESTHPSPESIPREHLRVSSGPGQEAHFRYSVFQGEKSAPVELRKSLSDDYHSMVTKVFTYAPYSLSVGTYDLYLFETDKAVGQYVGQLAVIDLGMCLNEGDSQTLFARIAQYSNDAASSQDHDDFVYPTTDEPPQVNPAPPAGAPSQGGSSSTASPSSPLTPTSTTRPINGPEKQKSNLPEDETGGDSEEPSDEPRNHLGPGAIAGITLGVLLATILGCTVSWFAFKIYRGREDENRHLVGGGGIAAGSGGSSFDDNCVDLESVDPLELLDIPATIRSPTGVHSTVLYPTPDSSMPSTTCTSPVGRLDYFNGDASNVEVQLRMAAGQLLAAGVSVEDHGHATSTSNAAA